ncbi:ribonuclease P protein subunit p14-like [Panonychus citri]|uniref:ribonuclease P protein subunit p14-like n=1 Tax=Panonychus citri TaxID=50023 RepID=UPI0023083362|nr:ribonuclease P protein subunit p14-like [Panonychus citri]XP_053205563.1 ribonuclease P protein subunit p14-like [Panonychus citri]
MELSKNKRYRFIRDDRFHIFADISIETQLKKLDICPRNLKLMLISFMKDAFGDYGVSIPIDVMSFSNKDCRAFIRFPARDSVRVQSALALAHTWENRSIHIMIHKISHAISSLCLNSHDQAHQIADKWN